MSALHVSLYLLCRSAGSVMTSFGDRRFAACSWASHAGSRGGGSLRVRAGSMTSSLGFLLWRPLRVLSSVKRSKQDCRRSFILF